MGDRVTVQLSLLIVHADAAREMFPYEPESENNDGELVDFEFSEVNYGDLGVESALQQAGIPYDKHWQQGGGFERGTEYARFTETGDIKVFSVYEIVENPDLSSLMALIDKPDKLRAFIVAHHNKVTPLSWDDQEEFARRFHARQLIASA